jgi:TPR repeat protein
LLLVFIGFAEPALAEVKDLTQACDVAAASPYDDQRPRYATGVVIFKVDTKAALAPCRAALEAAPDNPRLLFELGRVMEASRDMPAAVQYFSKSADLGYPAAQRSLGLFYIQGLGGLPEDEIKALRLFKQAADQGNSDAIYWIGVFLEAGRSVPRDTERARMWLKRAAEMGHVDAKRELSRLNQMQ